MLFSLSLASSSSQSSVRYTINCKYKNNPNSLLLKGYSGMILAKLFQLVCSIGKKSSFSSPSLTIDDIELVVSDPISFMVKKRAEDICRCITGLPL